MFYSIYIITHNVFIVNGFSEICMIAQISEKY